MKTQILLTALIIAGSMAGSMAGCHRDKSAIVLFTEKRVEWEVYRNLNDDYCIYNFSKGRMILTVSKPDPTGTIKVWIDRKSITWTSDSTFVLKEKKQ